MLSRNSGHSRHSVAGYRVFSNRRHRSRLASLLRWCASPVGTFLVVTGPQGGMKRRNAAPSTRRCTAPSSPSCARSRTGRRHLSVCACEMFARLCFCGFAEPLFVGVFCMRATEQRREMDGAVGILNSLCYTYGAASGPFTGKGKRCSAGTSLSHQLRWPQPRAVCPPSSVGPQGARPHRTLPAGRHRQRQHAQGLWASTGLVFRLPSSLTQIVRGSSRCTHAAHRTCNASSRGEDDVPYQHHCRLAHGHEPTRGCPIEIRCTCCTEVISARGTRPHSRANSTLRDRRTGAFRTQVCAAIATDNDHASDRRLRQE
jgi:hypothetical protein